LPGCPYPRTTYLQEGRPSPFRHLLSVFVEMVTLKWVNANEFRVYYQNCITPSGDHLVGQTDLAEAQVDVRIERDLGGGGRRRCRPGLVKVERCRRVVESLIRHARTVACVV
jgi:hypothetical protein